DERIRQLEFLNAHINAFVQEGGSLTGGGEFDLPEPPLPENYIIIGDFNMEPESPEYCALTGAGGGYYGRVARIGTPVD
ncbi:endonuclease, partial [Rhizobium ruizarguesonis]